MHKTTLAAIVFVVLSCCSISLNAQEKKIIAYLPTWGTDKPGIDQEYMLDHFYPKAITHLDIAFLGFKRNTNDWNDPNFASMELDSFDIKNIDSILTNMHVQQRCNDAGTKVLISVAGAGGYTFVWLLEKYYNDNAKLDEMADLIAQFAIDRNLDGVDLVLETWWDDPDIANSTDKGGRIRKPNSGNDQGPHEIGIGFTNLCKLLKPKLKAKNMLFSATVFSTGWYGNNYDSGFFDEVDWVGIMTYDLTGLSDNSPKGPHANLYDPLLNTYPGQTLNSPILSVDNGFKYWQGLLAPTWNSDGGFGMSGDNLLMGIPFYGFDFNSPKTRGYNHMSYKEIIHEFPNAATSYDPNDPYDMGGHIGTGGKDVYYDTPKAIKEKIKYVNDNNHAGLMIWQLNFDIDFYEDNSLLYSINENMNRLETITDSCLNIPAWNGSELFFGGDYVYHEGEKYRAIKHSTGLTPDQNSTEWLHLINCVDVSATGEQELNIQKRLNVISPIQNSVQLNLTKGEVIQVYNTLGELVFNCEGNNSSTFKMSTQNWKSGLYFFHFSSVKGDKTSFSVLKK